MKLLILGAIGPGALENYYIRGFRKLDVQCDAYDITDCYYQNIGKSLLTKSLNKIYPAFFFKKINEDLLQWIEGRRYDIIIIFKGLTLFPNTVDRLKDFASLVCCYNPDHPFKFYSPGSGNQNVLKSITSYDLYVSYSLNISRVLKDQFAVTTAVIPFGFDDEARASGTFSPDINGCFAFIGAYDRTRDRLIEALEVDNITIYGDEKWGYRPGMQSKSRKFYAGKSLYGQEYINAISKAAGVFNFLREQNLAEDSHNMRTFEVPGYGGLLISQRTSEQEMFFEDNKEAIYYDSIEELNDKLKFLSKNADYVQRIKQGAISKCKSAGFGYNQRSREWLNIMDSML